MTRRRVVSDWGPPYESAGIDGKPREPKVSVTYESPTRRKLGRNDPCWCGSGKKYKHCHLQSDLNE